MLTIFLISTLYYAYYMLKMIAMTITFLQGQRGQFVLTIVKIKKQSVGGVP